MAKMGNTNGRFLRGKKLSEETKLKISISMKGKKQSLSHIKNLTATKIGRKHSEEMKRKISDALRGEKSPSWKGGVTPLPSLVRTNHKYLSWRTSIFHRDRYTCILCKRKDEVSGHLNVDHFPKMFSEILYKNKIKTVKDALDCEELWDIGNGRTLCEECHYKHGKRKPDYCVV